MTQIRQRMLETIKHFGAQIYDETYELDKLDIKLATEECEAIVEEVAIAYQKWFTNEATVSSGMKEVDGKIIFKTDKELFQKFKTDKGL